MLSWHEPLVLSTRDEEYGKVLTPVGTKKEENWVRKGPLGQLSQRCSLRHAGVPQPSCQGFTACLYPTHTDSSLLSSVSPTLPRTSLGLQG